MGARGVTVALAVGLALAVAAPTSSAVSPSGTIAYSALAPNGSGSTDQYRVNLVRANGKGDRTLPCSQSREKNFCFDRFVAANRRTNRLLVTTDTAGQASAEQATILTSSARRIRAFDTADFVTGAAWAANGRKLVINSGGETQIYNTTGRRLANSRQVGEGSLSWSAEGAFIWSQNRTGKLVVAPATGGKRTVLSLRGEKPAWSPSGRSIAYLTGRGVYTAKRNGSGRRLISGRCDVQDGSVTWSPDSRFLACRSKGGALLVIDRLSGRARSLGGVQPVELAWLK